MADSSGEVIFETRQHASGNYTSNYPPSRQQLSNDGGGRSFLSYLTPRGITQIKERWKGGKNRKITRYAALFISSHADHVAVSSMNQITFLHKDDHYKEPRGYFTSGSPGTFTCGTWSEVHDVLALVDDNNTLYFIKANGEEITRISGQQLKVSLPILGLIFRQDTDAKKPCLCTFSILASDGLLHDIEISQDPSASFSASHLPHTGAVLKKQIPKNFSCMDYHPELSIFAMVNSDGRFPSTAEHPGSCSLSLWQRSSCSILELMVSIEFEGSFSEEKCDAGKLTSSKVLISPQGTFIATMDLTGCLLTFKFHKEPCNLVKFFDGKTHKTDLSNDVVDFTWWSDDVLAVVERKGTFMLFDVPRGVKLLENHPVYSMPILGTSKELLRCIFLLESTYSEKTSITFEGKTINDLCLIEQLDFAKMRWSLLSLSERSVAEMYDLLISKQDYHAAFSFADRHGLDKDEVLKSQWVSSGQGVNEIKELLSTIKDQTFVVSQCIECLGHTEDAAKALLVHGLHLTDTYKFSESEEDASSPVWDFRVARLKLLQFRDRLETFLGINMGRFSAQGYHKFRCAPINKAAIALAENGKIGALNLLFKRHPYSLSPFVLEILDAIPETLSVQSYAHLLPGCSPLASIAMREEDWVECDKMISFTNKMSKDDSNKDLVRTELIIKKCMGFQWPSADSLSLWYKNRAKNIDMLSGQLDNCMHLIDFACRKGIDLQHFLEDISYLHQLIYFDDNIEEMDNSLSLSAWEKLPDYEKFKLMLAGVRDENIIQRLQRNAIPFMRKRNFHATTISTNELTTDSFLVRWLKEISSDNKLELCLITIEAGCKDMDNAYFFRDETEVVGCALECIYLCSSTDRWSTMASILSKLPTLQGLGNESLKMQLKVAEGHIEAGRLLALYQVPKPINFFREAHNDEKAVKQIIRLILSKFIRRQLGRGDHEWATLWHDLQSLQEKAFPFLDLEYVLIEFCRGLLKAGKFSLARNYLKGTGSVVLAADKAENLVILAAREYFYSASSLDSPEVWKAKDCLNILPNSRLVRMESDVIDVITVKLPELGVKILPLQYRQMKDPLEIVKLAITSQAGAYLNVEELIEIAKLLGLTSHEDMSAVQEAIAREAAVAGDLQLASDLCLVLAKKGHGSVWDLCAALARSQLENMDANSRKFLLGFSLSHCDEESINDLLNVWKDLDMQGQCENLIMESGIEPPESSNLGYFTLSYPLYGTQGSADFGTWSGKVGGVGHDSEMQLNAMKDKLSLVAKSLPGNDSNQWESLLLENGKILSFTALRLPWLLELASKAKSGKKYGSVRMQAVLTIMSWLVRNGFAPKDDLLASLAKSIMESPVTEDEDILGCAFLLNFVDAFSGVGIIEGLVEERENYDEIASIMNVGLIYGLLHNRGVECEDAAQRRMLLFGEFQQKHKSMALDERDELNRTQTAFWREWKMKLEQHKRVADQSRALEQIIPGVETARFLSGDTEYIESVLFSLVESVKLEKKHILPDVLKLADTYNVDRSKVLLSFMSAVFTSDIWAVDDIIMVLSEFKNELVSLADDLIKVISLSVYPMIDGHDKHRLAYMYDLLSECYLKLEMRDMDTRTKLSHSSKIFGQECIRVSFIRGLNFKRIAGLQDLNWGCFNDEVSSHITEDTVEALANMVRNLRGIYGDTVPQDLLTWQYVYYCHVLNLLATLKPKFDSEVSSPFLEDLQCLVTELELTYDVCRKYLKFIEYTDTLEIMKQFFSVTAQFDKPSNKLVDSMWLECLIKLLNVWLKLMRDMEELKSLQGLDKSLCSECLMTSVEVFLNLIVKGEVSQVEGWGTVIGFTISGLTGDPIAEVSEFCGAMILAGCQFSAVANVFTDAMCHLSPGTSSDVEDLSNLYLTVLGKILSDLERGSLDQEHLRCFFLSLHKYEGNLEDLTHVRLAVWSKLSKFSDDLQLPSHVRVYILELMQRITTTGKLVKGLCDERKDNVPPWEGWENVQITSANHDEMRGDDDLADRANRLSGTLVALRSSQQLSAISPVLGIAPEDLSSVESAVACFLKISEAVQSESHMDSLIAMLIEWEDLFPSERKDSDSPKVDDGGASSWSNDEWDEGWEESFVEEEPSKKEGDNDLICSLHPLHSCWMDIFRKLARFSKYLGILKLIDKYKGQSITLLDEDDTQNLIEMLLELDHFAALKTALLLPYEAQQVQCLEAVEQKLRQEQFSDEVGRNTELLFLLLASGIISTVIEKSSLYGTTFSYICYVIGSLSRLCQEVKLSTLQRATTTTGDEVTLVFNRLVFPCFVAELLKCRQHILAGFLVTKLMHTNASLSLVNVAGSCLESYLQKQLQLSEDNDSISWEDLNLPNSISILRGKMKSLIQSALSLLLTEGR
ncbi:OLC1v1020891C1 [Oldenlandia corymbosa var. corymbosa]|uniref:OLC1v1020891C1 n=1 Tax=Oldenlandia corymbosa var. corymbosa TaxID=529605 RepID=A0AAV1BWV8_OLDCO|nr:OLC1v1020891C1 [Oldenlandia corymbosa var. corymbosa]